MCAAQDHQDFIAKYADYLAQKVYVYKLLGTSVERRPPTESKEWARKLGGFDLVKSLPAISQQFDKILVCTPYTHDAMQSQIPIAALSLLVKDAFRLYSTLTVLMLGVVDHYLELDANQTKLILSVCQAFRAQNQRFKKWTTALAELGFAHEKLFPELVPIPDALFELLQDHIRVKGGTVKTTTPPAAATSSAPKKAVAASAPPPKKSALMKKVAVESSDEEDSESDEEPVRVVTKKTAALAVTKKAPAPAPAPVAAAAPARKAQPAPQPQPANSDSDSDSDSESERERRERKRLKKEKKEAKRAKKEAKKKKREAAAAAADSDSEDEEEGSLPTAKPVKATKAAAAPGNIDFFAQLESQSNASHRAAYTAAPAAAAAAPSASAAFAMPVSSNVFNPFPDQPLQSPYAQQQQPQQPYGGFPQQYGAPHAYGSPQAYGAQQQYGAPPAYGGAYGQPQSAASSLAQLQPLSRSSHPTAAAASAPANDIFGDVAPDFATGTRGNRRA